MNPFSNTGISILYTELHEILPNPVYQKLEKQNTNYMLQFSFNN